MASDIPLSSEEHIKVVNKLCRSFKNVKLHEIPPLTHQLLQLTKEQNSMQIFMTLAEFFDTNLYKKLKFDTGCVDSQIPGKSEYFPFL